MFIVYVAYYIFDTILCEPFLLINNGELNLKQLALETFLLLLPPPSKVVNAADRAV